MTSSIGAFNVTAAGSATATFTSAEPQCSWIDSATGAVYSYATSPRMGTPAVLTSDRTGGDLRTRPDPWRLR